ncbi:hypothetical protein FALCPG4_004182 [Fusarium falciforme]
MAQEYSSLSLTYESDRLPVISGFVKRIGEATHDKYLGGLWEKTLYQDLLWNKLSHPSLSLAGIVALHSPSSAPLAPSSSWAYSPGAHWSGLVYCYFLGEDGQVQPEYDEIEGRRDVIGSNPYGQVKTSIIKISTVARYFP